MPNPFHTIYISGLETTQVKMKQERLPTKQ